MPVHGVNTALPIAAIRQNNGNYLFAGQERKLPAVNAPCLQIPRHLPVIGNSVSRVTERNAFHIVVTVRMSRDETTFFAQTPSASDSADVDDEISSLVKHSSGNTAPVVEEQKTDIPCKNLPGTKITLLTMEQVLIELLTRERPIYFLTVCSGIIYYTR